MRKELHIGCTERKANNGKEIAKWNQWKGNCENSKKLNKMK